MHNPQVRVQVFAGFLLLNLSPIPFCRISSIPLPRMFSQSSTHVQPCFFLESCDGLRVTRSRQRDAVGALVVFPQEQSCRHVPGAQPPGAPLPARPRRHAQLVDQQGGGGCRPSWTYLTFPTWENRQVRTFKTKATKAAPPPL